MSDDSDPIITKVAGGITVKTFAAEDKWDDTVIKVEKPKGLGKLVDTMALHIPSAQGVIPDVKILVKQGEDYKAVVAQLQNAGLTSEVTSTSAGSSERVIITVRDAGNDGLARVARGLSGDIDPLTAERIAGAEYSRQGIDTHKNGITTAEADGRTYTDITLHPGTSGLVDSIKEDSRGVTDVHVASQDDADLVVKSLKASDPNIVVRTRARTELVPAGFDSKGQKLPSIHKPDGVSIMVEQSPDKVAAMLAEQGIIPKTVAQDYAAEVESHAAPAAVSHPEPHPYSSEALSERVGIPIHVIPIDQIPLDPAERASFIDQVPAHFRNTIDLSNLRPEEGAGLIPTLGSVSHAADEAGNQIKTWDTAKPEDLRLYGSMAPSSGIIVAPSESETVAEKLRGSARVMPGLIGIEDTPQLRQQLDHITMEHEIAHTQQMQPPGHLANRALLEWDAEQQALNKFKDNPDYARALELRSDSRAIGNLLFNNHDYSMAGLLDKDIPYHEGPNGRELDVTKAKQMLSDNEGAFKEAYIRAYARSQGQPITLDSESLQHVIASAESFSPPQLPPDQQAMRPIAKKALNNRALYSNAIINGQDIKPEEVGNILSALKVEVEAGTITNPTTLDAANRVLKAAPHLMPELSAQHGLIEREGSHLDRSAEQAPSQGQNSSSVEPHHEANHAEPAVAGEAEGAPAKGRMGALMEKAKDAAKAVGDVAAQLGNDRSGKVRNPLANIGRKKPDNSREADAPEAAAPAQPAPPAQSNGGAETPPPSTQTPPPAEAGMAKAGEAAEKTAEAVDKAAEAAGHVHGRGGILGLAIGGALAGTMAAANDASAAEIVKASGKGVAGGILPGATEGFKNITQNNEHQNWVDQALNGADTATQGTVMVFGAAAGASGAVALGATALAPVTGGASLAVTAVAGVFAAGSMIVSEGAAVANIGVGLVHDVTYATGLSKEGGIITGIVEAGGGLTHSRVADRMEDYFMGNNSAVREELAAKGVTQEQLHKVEASLHKDGSKVSAQDTRDYLEAHNVSVEDVNKLDAKGLGDKMAALLASDELKAAKAACSTATHCDTPSAPMPGGAQKQHAAAPLVS